MEQKREEQLGEIKEAKKKTKKQQWIIIVIYCIMGGICGALGMGYIEQIRGVDTSHNFLVGEICSVLLFWGLFLVHIVIHEAGHLVFGLLTGYRFSSFRIGSIMLVKKNGKLQVKRFSLMGTGGQCLMIPPECPWEELPYRLYNLGGVLMNLLFVAVAGGVFLLAGENLYVQMFCVFFIVVGVGVALTNGIPIFGQVNNDGANAWRLGKNPEALRCFGTQMKINAMNTEEVRLKDIPEELFVMPSQKDMEQDALCSTTGILAFSREVDRKQFEKAREMGQALLKMEDHLLFIHKSLLITELVFLELIRENEEEQAEERKQILSRLETKEYKKFASAMKQNPSLLRMQYAYELLEHGDEKEAEKLLAQFHKVAKTYPNQCEIEGEKELLEIVKNTYERRKMKNEE